MVVIEGGASVVEVSGGGRIDDDRKDGITVEDNVGVDNKVDNDGCCTDVVDRRRLFDDDGRFSK